MIPFADDVQTAAQLWADGNASLFEFAIAAHGIVGTGEGETKRLAKQIRRSVDTVHSYAKGGGLWLEMIKRYPAPSEIFRNELEISFWNAVGRLYPKVITLDGAKMWLEQAIDEGWTVEKLRSMLPSEDGKLSPFVRAMRKIYKAISTEIIEAPALQADMTKKEYKRLLRVAGLMLNIAKRYSEDR